MTSIRSVTVYCSSSKSVDRVYLHAAAELGRAIGREGWTLVYGGNHVGCMGALSDGVREAGGKVIGITPQLLKDKGIADNHCDELIVTPDMRKRKALMEDRGDAFVALPGGIGTLEEIFEILVGRQLGCHNKPIVLLDIAGYYRPLLQMLEHGMETHFIRPGTTDLIFVAQDVESAIAYLRHPPRPPQTPKATAAAIE